MDGGWRGRGRGRQAEQPLRSPGGRVLEPAGSRRPHPPLHLPRREWERPPRTPSPAEPSARPRGGRGRGRGPAPAARPFPSRRPLPPNAGEPAGTRRPGRTVAPAAPQAPGSSGPRRPGGAGGLGGGGRDPARRCRRRSAPAQAGSSRRARHPGIEGRDSEAGGRQGPAQKPPRPRGAPEGPAGAQLRARHARLGPCSAPAARAAPPSAPAGLRGSALRIPSSRRLPAPRALRPLLGSARLTRTRGRLRPGPGRGPRPGAPWACSSPAPGPRGTQLRCLT